MTGPEHYQKAEDYLHDMEMGDTFGTDLGATYVAAAAVHATLAMAAATALKPSATEYDAWDLVAGAR